MNPTQALTGGTVAASPDMDNATAVAMECATEGAKRGLLGVIADFSAATAAIKTVTFKKGGTGVTGPVTATTLSRGSTDRNVASTTFEYAILRVLYSKAAVAAGTALAVGTIPINKWGIYLFSIGTTGTITSTAGAANFTTGYDTEAAAIAALPATPSGGCSMGYVTIQTKVGFAFVGGTDGLAGGASGNVANATNYASTAAIAPTTTIGAPVRWDFTLGPLIMALPGILRSAENEGVSAELEASGTGGRTGRIQLFYFSD